MAGTSGSAAGGRRLDGGRWRQGRDVTERRAGGVVVRAEPAARVEQQVVRRPHRQRGVVSWRWNRDVPARTDDHHAGADQIGDEWATPGASGRPSGRSRRWWSRGSAPSTSDTCGRCSTTRWCDSGDSSTSSPSRWCANAKRDSLTDRSSAASGSSNTPSGDTGWTESSRTPASPASRASGLSGRAAGRGRPEGAPVQPGDVAERDRPVGHAVPGHLLDGGRGPPTGTSPQRVRIVRLPSSAVSMSRRPGRTTATGSVRGGTCRRRMATWLLDGRGGGRVHPLYTKSGIGLRFSYSVGRSSLPSRTGTSNSLPRREPRPEAAHPRHDGLQHGSPTSGRVWSSTSTSSPSASSRCCTERTSASRSSVGVWR